MKHGKTHTPMQGWSYYPARPDFQDQVSTRLSAKPRPLECMLSWTQLLFQAYWWKKQVGTQIVIPTELSNWSMVDKFAARHSYPESYPVLMFSTRSCPCPLKLALKLKSRVNITKHSPVIVQLKYSAVTPIWIWSCTIGNTHHYI